MKKSPPPTNAARPIAEDAQLEESPKLPFPIVGIGASAGGLEAFTGLLQHLSVDTGMAFVLIQHLSPSHKSLLASLLDKQSKMPVVEVTDGLTVLPNHIYVIPPNSCMHIKDGKLRLKSRAVLTAEQNLPIDVFLSSLAEHQKNKAIAVILSGTASDGSQGVRSIKDHGGITFAQDEKSAQFDMMPRNAVATGDIDFVLPPKAIAKELQHLSRHPYLDGRSQADEIMSEAGSYDKILLMLQKTSGIDFKSYKPSTLKRRIFRRMMLNKMETAQKYVAYLTQHPKEVEILSQDVFITVTRFFRDPGIFEALKHDVFPQLAVKQPPETIRIWVLGCSTGEEVYSIAISLLEYLENKGNYNIQIFATDIKEAALEKARLGVFPDSIAADVSAERLVKFFIKVPQGYQIIKSLREMCIFARQNVVSDPPFSRLDWISCRNLLIYLDNPAQKRIMPIFHYALNRNGFLLLGQAEGVGAFTHLFNTVNGKARIYSKNSAQRTPQLSLGPAQGKLPEPNENQKLTGFPSRMGVVDIQREADRAILKRNRHSGVVINEAMEVIQFRGDTSRYLKHLPGSASLNLLRMVQEGIFVELRQVIEKVVADNISLKSKTVRIKHEGGHLDVAMEIIPFKAPPQEERYFLIVFEEPQAEPKKRIKAEKAVKTAGRSSRVKELEQELESTRLHLQGTIDDKEAANEGLQSANEEILSTNEELQSLNEEFQSANEELESAKEELQATNEEIMTLNDELQKRNSELSVLNDDHVNLMRSTNLPVVMMGPNLKIRSFTPASERILRLIPGDVGRPWSDIKMDMELPDFERAVINVMNTGNLEEIEVRDRKGCWFKIQIRPYKTGDNKTGGAVITFMDITELKETQARIQAYAQYREAIVQTIHNPLVVLDSRFRIKFANHSFFTSFNLSPDVTMNRFIYDLGNGEWNIPELRTLFDEILPKHKMINDYSITHACPGIGHPRTLLVNARKIRGEDHEELILLTIEDITERKRSEEQLKMFTEELKRSNADLEQFAQIASHDIQEPLKIVNNYVQLLQKKIKPEEDKSTENFVEIIGKEINYIQSLVRGLLAYARIDSGEKIFEEIDCSECLENALATLQIVIKEAQAHITSERLPVITGDKVQITRLFQNLINNSIKFKSSQEPRIDVRCQEKEGVWEISIADNGIGIAPENFDKIFGIFNRLDKSYPGSGIGLSEVKKIVGRHGGRISVKSTLGQGTTFVITLPR